MPPADIPQELIEELPLSSRGGRRAAAPLSVEEVRPLTEADLPEILNPPPVGSKPGLIKRLQHHHHTIAQMLARGATKAEISLVTGFSPAYLSILDDDPSIKELVAAYREHDETLRVDAMQRLADLGLSAVEEIQRKLDEEPEKFTVGQLTELVDLGLLKPKGAGGGGVSAAAPTGAPLVQVTFVKSEHADGASASEGRPTIDLKPANRIEQK